MSLKTQIPRIEPPNWWVGFKNAYLQLLVHFENISMATIEVYSEEVSVIEINKADSPNYLFIDLHISEHAKPGCFDIVFKFQNEQIIVYTYELKRRVRPSEAYIGFNSSDVIYLITPDRFAKGDPNKNILEGFYDTEINRKDDYARHGGDIKGITNNLDYIESLGFTTIWPTPLLTNNMRHDSYHGYAITDFYEIDPRFGTLEDYLELASILSSKGMKLIMDQVANHCGIEHWWMTDLPFKDWINHQDNYIKNKVQWNESKSITSTHRHTTNQDIYASQFDKNALSKGWFSPTMPDLNQRNPFMARYTIQNSIWWIEKVGLNGIRQDTYPYLDKTFLSSWAGEIMNEYPNFSIVGEETSINPLIIAYWQQGHLNLDGYNSNLKSPMDFALQGKIINGLNEMETWGSGLITIYDALANDFAYYNPKDIMLFVDNHDTSRVFTKLRGDTVNTKMALSYILVLPRIPQIYYGTEILMNDFRNPADHGVVRSDFPGGWEDDKINAFTGVGLNEAQKDMQSFLKKLLNYRKTSKAIHEGKTIHFTPENGIYVLFRIHEDETVVHIMNKNDAPVELHLNRFEEIGLIGKTLVNISDNSKIVWQDVLILHERGVTLLTTKH